MKVLIVFVVLSLINVIMSTIKSVLTVKSSKGVATIANAIYYSFYTLVVKQLASVDYVTAFIVTLICNLVGVYLGFVIMDLFKKEKVWRVTITAKDLETKQKICDDLANYNIGIVQYEKIATFDVFAKNKKESEIVKTIIKDQKCKYFIQEMEKKF